MTRTAVAVFLEVVFVFLAFGVRSWVQWRRTGSTGFVLPRRDAPAAERLGAAAMIAAIVLLAIAPIDGPRTALFDNLPVAGFVLATAGIVLCVAAQLTMGDSWRIGVDTGAHTTLVTSGIFASVRNPIFSAMILSAAGFALLLPNLFAFAALATLVIGLEVQVRLVEEPYLRTEHGAAYRDYSARAGRFLPRIGRRPGRGLHLRPRVRTAPRQASPQPRSRVRADRRVHGG